MNLPKYFLCDIYRADRVDELYLFVRKPDGFDLVPEKLVGKFRSKSLVTSIRLDSARKLARADSASVMKCLEQQGYYLQMPPSEREHLGDIADKNEILPR